MIVANLATLAEGNWPDELHKGITRAAEEIHGVFAAVNWQWSGMAVTADDIAMKLCKLIYDCAVALNRAPEREHIGIDSGRLSVTMTRLSEIDLGPNVVRVETYLKVYVSLASE